MTDCARCHTLQATIESLSDRLNQAGEDVHALEIEQRRLRRKITVLQRELDGKRAEDPKAKEVADLLQYAKEQWGKTDKWAIDPAGDRWNLTLKQLKRPAYNHDILKTCIDGVTREPWVGPRGRSPEEYPGARKMVDITYAYGDDDRIRAWLDKAELLANPRPAPAAPVATDIRKYRRGLTWEQPIQKVLNALRARELNVVPQQADTWKAQCPGHDDRNPSLGISLVETGDVLLFCRAGCRTEDVVGSMGLAMADLFAESRAA